MKTIKWCFFTAAAIGLLFLLETFLPVQLF